MSKRTYVIERRTAAPRWRVVWHSGAPIQLVSRAFFTRRAAERYAERDRRQNNWEQA